MPIFSISKYHATTLESTENSIAVSFSTVSFCTVIVSSLVCMASWYLGGSLTYDGHLGMWISNTAPSSIKLHGQYSSWKAYGGGEASEFVCTAADTVLTDDLSPKIKRL